jgi:methionyl-tRNA synthetase
MPPDAAAAPKKFLVTMALPYANGDLHLGHLLEAVQTDVFVRFQKLLGHEAVYVAADDTHGTPIELSALRRGITPEALVAGVMADHLRDYAGFNIGFDIFSSTNSEENRRYAELIYANLQKNGLIVEREIEQFYCEHDKRFLPDRFIVGVCPKCGAADQYGDVCESCGTTYQPTDLGEPQCIICRRPPVIKRSKHLYVQLAECEPFLREFIARPELLRSDMRNFVQTWINDGLREWCISRDGPYFGFKIPGTPDKYFYVWLDAPIGYLSSTDRWCRDHGRDVAEFWSRTSDARVVHFIGKDIVYFHTLFWPVLLENSGFKLPSTIFIHGFLNVGGEKMSKSRGTFILAKDFLTKIKHPQASEFLRFFFAAKLGGGAADIDMNAPEFISRVNTTLANNFGNLHHRTFVFCDRSFSSRIPDAPWDEAIAAEVGRAAADIARFYGETDYKAVVERVHEIGNLGNKYYQDRAPWELMKSDPAAAGAVMVTCVNLVKAMAVFLKPIMPKMTGSLEAQLGLDGPLVWGDHVFSLRNRPLGKTAKLVTPITDEDLAPLFTPPAPAAVAPVPAIIAKEPVDIDAFRKVELRVVQIVEAVKVPKSKKLLQLQVECGNEKRQILAGIAESYAPAELVGRCAIAVVNLKPATIMGLTSQGMLLAASGPDGKPILLAPEKPAPIGATVS